MALAPRILTGDDGTNSRHLEQQVGQNPQGGFIVCSDSMHKKPLTQSLNGVNHECI